MKSTVYKICITKHLTNPVRFPSVSDEAISLPFGVLNSWSDSAPGRGEGGT